MKVLIIGGCFLSQPEIPFQKLFHQSLKQHLIKEFGDNVRVDTIRYERLGKVLEKVNEFRETKDFDCLIFHLRTEPFTRLVKFSYKYLDDDGVLHRSINLPFLTELLPERFESVEKLRVNLRSEQNVSKARILLRDLNFRLGVLCGNQRKAFKFYQNSILQLNDYCRVDNKSLLLMGPALRPYSKVEDNLAKRMNKKYRRLTFKHNINYLEMMDKTTPEGQSLFQKDGMHISLAGHEYVGRRMFEEITAPRQARGPQFEKWMEKD